MDLISIVASMGVYSNAITVRMYYHPPSQNQSPWTIARQNTHASKAMHLRTRLRTFFFLFALLVVLQLLPQHAEAGLHSVRSPRKLIVKQTAKPTAKPTDIASVRKRQSSLVIGPGAQYDFPSVHYEMWTTWNQPASGAIPSCTYWCGKKRKKGRVIEAM